MIPDDNVFATRILDSGDIIQQGDTVEYSSGVTFFVAGDTIGKEVSYFPVSLKFYRKIIDDSNQS